MLPPEWLEPQELVRQVPLESQLVQLAPLQQVLELRPLAVQPLAVQPQELRVQLAPLPRVQVWQPELQLPVVLQEFQLVRLALRLEQRPRELLLRLRR